MDSEERTEQYVRIVYKTPEFETLYSSLPPKTQTKFDYVINVIATIYNVPTKFVKHLENTDLYEMRVSSAQTNIGLSSLLSTTTT